MKKSGYDNFFNTKECCNDKSKRFRAFEKAHDIRKFEIDLYWKRTTYFWTLLVAIFTGYFLFLSSDKAKIPYKDIYLTLIACIGFVFSIAWNLAVKGSKFWQENWESHLDMLEDDITGPLYKIVIADSNDGVRWSDSSAPFSVSNINHRLSQFLIVTWLFLMLFPVISMIIKKMGLYTLIIERLNSAILTIEVTMILLTIAFTWKMITKGMSKFNNGNPTKKITATLRKTEFKGDVQN